MDPLGVESKLVDIVGDIESWQSTAAAAAPAGGAGNGGTAEASRLPFVGALNKKVAVWVGDLTVLRCGAIAYCTTESLDDPGTISTAVHHGGGAQLTEACRKLRSCKTGEVKMTEGFELPARHVVHAVGPRYNKKYETAAESALFSCYRNTLQHFREEELDTLALSALHSERRAYPIDKGAHLAIRCVRRFLEKHADSVNRIVFCLTAAEARVYEEVMPLYFPRSKAEEAAVADQIPENIGNEDGEPLIAERQITISAVVGKDDDDVEVVLESGDSDTLHSFASMAGDHDQARAQKLGKGGPGSDEGSSRYRKLLLRAKDADLSDLEAMQLVFRGGKDTMGRPILAVVGKRFPKHIDIQRGVLHCIEVMDPIVNQDYCVVYFQTESSSTDADLRVLKRLYELCDARYQNNLAAIYNVHPSFWSRMFAWMFLSFNVPNIKQRMTDISALEYLYDAISPDQIAIPDFVLAYDKRNNPSLYAAQGNGGSSSGDAEGL